MKGLLAKYGRHNFLPPEFTRCSGHFENSSGDARRCCGIFDHWLGGGAPLWLGLVLTLSIGTKPWRSTLSLVESKVEMKLSLGPSTLSGTASEATFLLFDLRLIAGIIRNMSQHLLYGKAVFWEVDICKWKNRSAQKSGLTHI